MDIRGKILAYISINSGHIIVIMCKYKTEDKYYNEEMEVERDCL